MIKCENLYKLFTANIGIKNINITFEPGTIYGIIGYNGAGKTTLLRCLEGLYIPTSGYVYHNAIPTTHHSKFVKSREKISYLPTDEYLYKKLTCLENIELATILRTGKKKIEQKTQDLIIYFDVKSYINKKFGDCSTGMRKKIQIIISLIGNINTLIWDEPDDGLDILTKIKLKKLIRYYKENNITVLVSSHVLEFLEGIADRIVLIKDGEIIEQVDAIDVTSLENLYLKHLPEEIPDVPFVDNIRKSI
jgi:ABC-type multidrug transport system ATPase subunit